MESFNVLRGREPIVPLTETHTETKIVDGEEKEVEVTTITGYYCAGYIKFMPDRAKIFGIEFSGGNKEEGTYDNPQCGFDYYVFCSETAWRNYVKEAVGVDLKAKVAKEAQNVGNPALFIVSSGNYDPETWSDGSDVYPHLIGFQGVTYSHEPIPYSNVDAFVNSNDVQYPLYLFVKFNGDPKITELDYQLIYGK